MLLGLFVFANSWVVNFAFVLVISVLAQLARVVGFNFTALAISVFAFVLQALALDSFALEIWNNFVIFLAVLGNNHLLKFLDQFACTTVSFLRQVRSFSALRLVGLSSHRLNEEGNKESGNKSNVGDLHF